MAVAIVLAAGTGSRMGTDIPKQFLHIKGKEVVYYSLSAFNNSEVIDEIVLVTRQEDIEFCKKEIVEKYNLKKVTKVIAGGSERYESVYKGILAIEDVTQKIVMVHDGARPFVTSDMIARSVEAAKKHRACTVGVPVKDTIKIVSKENGEIFGDSTPDRNFLYQIQTPQTFEIELLKSSYEKMWEDENHNITDDTMLVEQYNGVKSNIILGAYENIKITTPEDIEIAEKFLEKN